MTSEMAFECLFVSSNPELFRTIAGILRELSISVDICLRSSRASETLRRGSVDLLVIDCKDEHSSQLVQEIWKNPNLKKPIVVALSDSPVRGAHVVIQKPITAQSALISFKGIYQRMLLDYRRHKRHVLMLSVLATTEHGRRVPLVVTDIGDGGVGLCSRENLSPGDVLSFRLLLPGASREILIHARVVWTREYARLGCEFVRIPPVDLMILHDWLRAKSRVKKPHIEV